MERGDDGLLEDVDEDATGVFPRALIAGVLLLEALLAALAHLG